MKNVIVSWSGGKDSAFAIYDLMKNDNYHIKGLLATTSEGSGRLPMHEVKREFIHAQAESLRIPLYEVKLPSRVGNSDYEQALKQQFDLFKEQGVQTIVYADLFLEDIKEYRDQLLSNSGMEGFYPLWERETLTVARKFISEGFKAIVTTVDSDKLPTEMAGQPFDEEFLSSLPKDVDPCGENGEFHTFVFDGPIYNELIPVTPGVPFQTRSGRFVHVELIKQ
ncbi:Dph6-related ATP pyrophosphatase [Halobacillus amylolyticus]|uniref:Diphthine--ammonia ligase n=1 Tax=Halobacillus amylolyticus TaxID=2932259 RepID=A0ABY4HAH7_9BACI|nr:diphthine--ammonia ligase [Halobacillus amylolyticus]UOR11891.1 diphthine--ammonia ligase [Halobacillus amylolyticus]